MLIPRSHVWTPLQRWLIVGAIVFAFFLFGTVVYSYERYYRGLGERALFGTWQKTSAGIDQGVCYEFRPDHTFSILAQGRGIVITGRWYAGGENIYIRFDPDEFGPHRPFVFQIEDISPTEMSMRVLRKGGTWSFKRVNVSAPRAPNQRIQHRPTADHMTADYGPQTTPPAVADLTRPTLVYYSETSL